MKKLAMLAVVPLFAGYLCAQSDSQTTTNSTKTWNGTLVDASCYSTHHSESKESNSDANGTSTTSKSETRTENVCPVTEQTSTFGIVSPSGEYMSFDQPSSERVVEMVRKHHKWNTYITEKKPITVRVVGTPNGKTIVVRDIE